MNPTTGQVPQAVDRQAFEREARRQGYWLIAGVDEVGRAAWAGPMVAAAVILPEAFHPLGIRSSKKMRPAARQTAYERIVREATAVAVREASAADIDARGIDTCHMDLLRDVVGALVPEPDYVLVDHYTVPGLRQPQKSIDVGDDLSVSIGAASIVAKVTCDRILTAFAQEYPGYGFADNHGYRSDEHLAGLDQLGPCPIHRRSVSSVRKRLITNDHP